MFNAKTRSVFFAFAIFFSLFLTSQAQKVFGQSGCTISVNPLVGDLNTVFQVTSSGCPDGSYYVTLAQGGEDISNNQVNIRDGSFTYSFRAPGPGSVQVILNQQFITYAQTNVEVRDENPTPPGEFKCGDIVPPAQQIDDPCPANCPMTDHDGNGGIVPFRCGCGGLNQPRCPAGNQIGSAECLGELIYDPAKQACVLLDMSGTAAAVRGDCPVNNIDTAVGCIPIESIISLSAFFLAWGLGLGGGFAILVLVAAAFQIMTSSGDPTKLASGKSLLISALSGIFLLVFGIFLLRIFGVNVLGLFS